jgi:DMSO/TMAO reductase YedYZ heme-binding membrane subunit
MFNWSNFLYTKMKISVMKKYLITLCFVICTCIAPLMLQSPSYAMIPSAETAVTHRDTVNELSIKAQSSWPWYVTRASGLTAAALLILLMLSGIGQLTGFSYRFMEPLVSWSLHRALAIALGASIFVHGGVLLFDRYTPFNLLQLLFPFASHYKPATIFGAHLGSLYVTYGIIASYIAAILIFTSLFLMNKKQAIWRLLHYLSYVLVVLVFLHGLYLGTDIAHGATRVVWWIGGILICIGVLSRLRRAWTLNQDK